MPMHLSEEAGAEAEEEGATADSAGKDGDENWVQQASWGEVARGKGHVLVDGQEEVPEEAGSGTGSCSKEGTDTGCEGCSR